ncbi:unnamed protein product [Gordionus sp. m RMFG-2023]
MSRESMNITWNINLMDGNSYASEESKVNLRYLSTYVIPFRQCMLITKISLALAMMFTFFTSSIFSNIYVASDGRVI